MSYALEKRIKLYVDEGSSIKAELAVTGPHLLNVVMKELSLREIGRRSGLSPTYLSQVRKGTVLISIGAYLTIIEVLKTKGYAWTREPATSTPNGDHDEAKGAMVNPALAEARRLIAERNPSLLAEFDRVNGMVSDGPILNGSQCVVTYPVPKTRSCPAAAPACPPSVPAATSGRPKRGGAVLGQPRAKAANVKMGEAITITIPVPPRVITPNGRTRNPNYRRAVQRKHASDVAACIIGALHGMVQPRWKAVTIDVTHYHKGTRKMDDGNLIAGLKCAEDVLQSCGIVANDSGVRWGKVSHAIDRRDPRVELTITPLAEGKPK